MDYEGPKQGREDLAQGTGCTGEHIKAAASNCTGELETGRYFIHH